MKEFCDYGHSQIEHGMTDSHGWHDCRACKRRRDRLSKRRARQKTRKVQQ